MLPDQNGVLEEVRNITLMFALDEVVPWRRPFDDYLRMFALNDADLRSRTLGCADGPASFNAEANRQGLQVISAEPLYGLDADTIRDRIQATYSRILEQTLLNTDQFVWDTIHSVDELGHMRMEAMQAFLDDYDRGRQEGHYVEGELPMLPFADQSFDLALCSHFLSLYTHLSEGFPYRAVLELCRVAREVRIAGCLGWSSLIARGRH